MTLNELINTIKKVNLLSNKVTTQHAAGVSLSKFKGRGGLFDSVRKYEPGDDVRSINWNVTARLSETYINTYNEDKSRRVWLLVDVSGSGMVGTTRRRKIDLEMEISATIAYSAILDNDNVGSIFFSDKIEKLIMPVKGMNGFWYMAKSMVSCNPCAGVTNIESALNFLMKMNCTGNIIFIISDFIGLNYERACNILSQQNEVIIIRVYDKIENELPNLGWVNCTDIESGKKKWFNTSSKSFRKTYKEQQLKSLNNYQGFLSKSGLRNIEIRTDEDIAEKLSLLSN